MKIFKKVSVLALALGLVAAPAVAMDPYMQFDYGAAVPAYGLGNQSIYKFHAGVDLNKYLAVEAVWEGAWMQPRTPQGDFNEQSLGLSTRIGYPVNDVVTPFIRLSGGEMLPSGTASTNSPTPYLGAGFGADINTKLWGLHLVAEYNYTRTLDAVYVTAPGVSTQYQAQAFTVGVKKTF